MLTKKTLSIPVYDAHHFSWSKGHGTTEASTLGIPVGAEPGSRVWADSCDVGFVIQGEREPKLFIFDHDSRFPDGSYRSWFFVSEDRKHTVYVFND
jgi:hypothetical protein